MTIRFLAVARRELLRAARFYETRDQGLGDRLLEATAKALRSVRDFPDAHPPIDGRHRRILLARFPYALIYPPRGRDDLGRSRGPHQPAARLLAPTQNQCVIAEAFPRTIWVPSRLGEPIPSPGVPMRIGGRRFLLSLAIIGAAVCLALGTTLPIIKLSKWWGWSITEHSLWSTVQVLIRDGQVLPALPTPRLLTARSG